MPSERRYIPFRPDAVEDSLLAKLAKKRGLSMSRLIGQAIREMAEREGVEPDKSAVDAVEGKKED